MDISQEIREVCQIQFHRSGAVFPPQVCPHCLGCPIATIVVGVGGIASPYVLERLTGDKPVPIPIPVEKQPEVRKWLERVRRINEDKTNVSSRC